VFDPQVFVIGGGAVQRAGFERSLIGHHNEHRSRSTVTASINNPDRITVLDADSAPGIDGALYLATRSIQVSDRSIRTAINEGETP
jgi:hypothetical protein